ncbi:conserved protein of unknown function [Legionella micdadei]|uniref:Uncharacterized protein n=1 Tax=Legionella micdadei TaxID=451 RepID=A0A098GHP5_LEGMI|nr:hypothetical protein Lmic_1517 [Legionella micdadei]CEG61001.1 conserved protein of unknown function [Legionella micdadei]SCY70257.1 hypothetical protein SAMN02982997_02569 [Legionella micdadei]
MAKNNFFKREWKIFKKFYNQSPENRIGFFNFLAFIVIPIIGMTILYIVVRVFWIK